MMFCWFLLAFGCSYVDFSDGSDLDDRLDTGASAAAALREMELLNLSSTRNMNDFIPVFLIHRLAILGLPLSGSYFKEHRKKRAGAQFCLATCVQSTALQPSTKPLFWCPESTSFSDLSASPSRSTSSMSLII